MTTLPSRFLPSGHTRLVVWVLSVLLLVVVAVAALHLPFSRNAIRQRVEAWMGEAGLDARLGDLQFNLTTLSFTVGPVSLAATGTPDRPFFTAARVTADLPWSVAWGPFRIDSLIVDDPRLTLNRDARGTLNLPQGSDVDEGGGGLDAILIGSLVVDGLDATFNDAAAEIALNGRDVTVLLAPPISEDVRGTLRMAGGMDLTLGERRMTFDRVDAELGFDGRDVVLEPLTIATADGEVRLSGRLVDVVGDMTLDLTLDGTLPIEGLRDSVPELAEITGPMTLSGRLTGSARAPDLALQLSTADLGWRSYADVAMEGDFRVTTEGLQIERLEATSARGFVTATGALLWSEGTSQLETSWDALEIGPLLREAIGDRAPQLSAVTSGTASASWTGLSFELDTLDLDTEFSRSTAVAGLPVTGTLTAAISGGRWTLRQNQRVGGTALTSDLAGRWSPDNVLASSLDGSVRIDVARIEGALQDLQRLDLVPASALEGLDLQGQALLDARVAGQLGTPDLAGALRLEGTYTPAAADASDAPWPPLDLALTGNLAVIDGEQVTLGAIDAQAGTARVSGSAALAIETNRISGMLDAEVPSLSTLPLPATMRGMVGGALAGRVQMDGTAADPVVTATLTGSGLEMAGQRFASLDGRVGFDAGTLQVGDLTLVQPGGTLSASGSYTFSTGQFTVDATADALEIRQWTRAPVVETSDGTPPTPESTVPLSGALSFDVNGSGSLASPSGQVQVTLADGRWQDVELGSVSMSADVVDGLAQVNLDAPAFGVGAEGDVAVVAPRTFDVRAELDHADVGALARQWVDPDAASRVQGRVAATLDAEGVLDDLEAADVDVSLTTLDVTVNDVPVRIDSPASIRYLNRRLTAENVEIIAGESVLHAEGELAEGGTANRLTVSLQGQLADFTRLAGISETTESLVAAGPVTAALDIEGTFDEPVVTGQVALRGATLGWADVPAVEALDATVTIAANAVDLDLPSVRWQGATLEARASVPAALTNAWVLGTDTPPGATDLATFSARFDAVVPSLIEPFAPELAEELDGAVAGTVNLQTATPDLDSLAGEIILDTARLEFVRVPFNQLSTTRLVIEEGAVRVDDWTWGGAGNEVSLGGSVLLAGDPTLELSVLGALDLRVLSVLQDGLSTAGAALLDVSVAGPVTEPALSGYIDLQSVSMRLADPRLIVSGVGGLVNFTGDRIELDGVTGEANGGAVDVGGFIDFADLSQPAVELQLTGEGLAFEYPEGLRTELMVDVMLVDADGRPSLTGTVEIQRGSYRAPLNLTNQVLARLQSTTIESPAAGAPGWVDRIQLDVRVVTDEDIYVDNNYGRLEIGVDVRLTGTVGRPGMLGRATLREGGTVFLGGNTYTLTAGTIDFTDPTRIAPRLAITAQTRVSTYAITLNLSGSPEAFRADLSSNPPLGQGDVVSLLMTGRTLEESGGLPAGTAGTQALRYLSGDILGFLGQTVGFTRVRLERGVSDDLLDLSSADADPATRLTIAQNLSDAVEVVFSQNLRESGALTWLVNYRPFPSFTLTYVARDDNSDSFGFRHELSFGGQQRVRVERERAEPLRISDVTITGNPGSLRDALAGRLRLGEGDEFDFFRWQDDRDRLERELDDRGYFEAQVTATRQEGDGTVQLEYDVQPGPRTALEVEGLPAGDALIPELEQIWRDAVLDEFLVEDLRQAVVTSLARQGYLQPEIAIDIDRPTDETKTTRITVEPGTMIERREIVFEGHTVFTREELLSQIAVAGLADEAWVSPDALADRLEASYRANGYIDARVTIGAPLIEGVVARLPVQIDEGAEFHVAAVDLEGIEQRDASLVRADLGVEAGDVYRPQLVETGRAAVDAAYRAAGFNQVQSAVDVLVDRDAATVTATLSVQEGPRQILREVVLAGDVATRRSTIDEALQLEPGTPVNTQAWYEASRRLYQTGVFRSVDIDPRPIETAGTGPDPATQPVRALVTLEEWAPYRFRYGLQVNSDPVEGPAGGMRETSLGLVADIQRRNLFGRGITTGVAVRYRPDRRATRVFMSTLRTFGLPLTSSVFFTDSRETFNAEGVLPFTSDERSVTFEQRVGQLTATQLAYSYRFERNHTFIPDDPSDFPFDIVVDIARLNSTALHDSRDNPLNAVNGWFHSSSLEYAQGWLASDVRFVKYLAQQFQYPSVGPVVLASAVRFGVGWPLGIDEELIPSERFFAGGGTTVRGYEQDSLGEVDFFGDPRGGEALLILNQEARFPVYRWLSGVGFIDAGNVFATPSDISIGELKVGVGLGMRVDTPFGLFRVDFGVPVDRREGDSAGAWYFSIGQVF